MKPLVCWIIKEYRVKREGGPGVNPKKRLYILGVQGWCLGLVKLKKKIPQRRRIG